MSDSESDSEEIPKYPTRVLHALSSSSESDDDDDVPMNFPAEDEINQEEHQINQEELTTKSLNNSTNDQNGDDQNSDDPFNLQNNIKLNEDAKIPNKNQLMFADSSDEEDNTNLQEIREVPEDGDHVIDEEDLMNENDQVQDNWMEFSEKKNIESEEEKDEENVVIKEDYLSNSINVKPKNPFDSDSESTEFNSQQSHKIINSDSDDDSSNSSESEESDECLIELPGSPNIEDDIFLQEHLNRLTQKAEELTKNIENSLENSENIEDTATLIVQDEDDLFTRPIVVQQESEEEFDPSISDFDRMIIKKKSAKSNKRKRKRDTAGSSFISDADEIINDLMRKMNEAASLDKQAALSCSPAIMKLKLLPSVIAQFQIKDYQEQFIENGVMTAIADWLSPLPTGALPNLKIRSVLLDTLLEFPVCSTNTLKASGVGKAIKRLSVHPKELKDNKNKCRKLIKRWCKQIFNINDSGGFSKEERQERDLEHYQKYGPTKRSKFQISQDVAQVQINKLKVHERGFVSRARVPTPSNKDYLIRPKNNIDIDNLSININDIGKKGIKRIKTGNELKIEKTKQRLNNMKMKMKVTKCANVKVMGTKGIL